MAKGWDTAASVCAGGVSLVCMSSMTAALLGTGAAAGAGAAGMAGMDGSSVMGSMGAGSSTLAWLPGVLEQAGLGFLNRIPNPILQPLLVILLLVSVAAAWLAYRSHRRLPALILTVVSAVVMYLAIYVWMSAPLYLLSLIGVVGAGVWGMFLAGSSGRVRPAAVEREAP